ncbi:MAG TPA: VOC family protein [Gaiellaceae bacterium]|jgi:predicted enzyme related to lactoylglutathione lyase
MFKDANAFSGFSVDDLDRAKQFYGETLGLNVSENPAGFELHLGGGGTVFVYPKGEQHTPASFTILNFPVENIDQAADDLAKAGVQFERYDGMHQDDRAIMRGGDGPTIAWFKDPAGNILSVLEQSA